MKKLFIILSVFALVLCGCSKQEQEVQTSSEPMYYIEHGEYSYYVYEDHTELKEFLGSASDRVELPATFYDSERKIDLPLTVIGRNAFNRDSGARFLVIPDSVTTIKSAAFMDCIGLEEVVLGRGITTIESGAFSGCWGIKSINIPDSVQYIGDMAFAKCASVEKINLGAGLLKLGDGAFSGCLSLSEVTAGAALYDVGSDAFENTPWLDGLSDEFSCLGGVLVKYNGSASEVTIPENVTSIAEAFEGNTEISSVKIPGSVTAVCQEAFRGCTALETVEIPDSVTMIGSYAFADTPYLNTLKSNDGFCVVGDGVLLKYTGDDLSFKIPDNVKYISDAFRENNEICDVRIGDNTHTIGEDAFFRCESLEMVIISPEVSYIDPFAFDGCEIAEFNTEDNKYALKWAKENGIANIV